ncbi:hypothetical protein SAMN02745248_02255 [Hathewaya proteolytica DSM 3090]|uniref:Uncharacterized protein n=1 Tax=Hathewaya proteolytica DSM 3090 TaxID=1121331 RepID=A0A1M6RCH1_9CLOT|nr:hypothetical protein [Hathewaya proteolytica]SHK30100.1 hypothetical protein SAMN02745248_02255 [Hathewaya proteolytica DSM 3090]
MRYKVQGEIDLWGWTDFKTRINAQIVDYKTESNHIYWVEFETDLSAGCLNKFLEEYGLKIVTEDQVKEKPTIDNENEPMMFYKLDKGKQDALISWINTNFNKIKGINKDMTSLQLKDFFKEFPITNGEFKGAMVEKCGFQYHPNDGLNWYFNISKKSPALLDKENN